jgi:Tat protein secretion system quality control protein TatD with DNase activity
MPPVHHHVFHCFSPSIKESMWQKALYLSIETMVLFFSKKIITHLKQMVKVLDQLDPLRVAAGEKQLGF